MAAPTRIDELRKRYDENQRRFFAPLANEYRKAGDLEQAIALCRQHLVDAPGNISGQIVFGQALYDAGTFDESRTVFETAIGLDPENLIALRHLGDIARAQSDVPRAREWYQRVLDADRRNEEVLALMAELAELEKTQVAAAAAAAEESAAAARMADVAPPAATVPDAASPRSSMGSLVGADAPTLQIVAHPMPAPAEEPAPPEPERVASEPVAPEMDAHDFGMVAAEPPAETYPAADAEQAPHDPSFGFDVDLAAASDLPVATGAQAESTPDFGVVEISDEAPFRDSVHVEAPPPFSETSDFPDIDAPRVSAFTEVPAEDEPVPVEEWVADVHVEPPVTIDAPVAVIDVAALEFDVEPATTAPPAPVAPPHAPSGPLEAFELTEPVAEPLSEPVAESAEPEAAAEPFQETYAEAVQESTQWVADPVVEAEAEPEPEFSSTFESFDPIRQMPTPIAPVTPIESHAAGGFVDEPQTIPEPEPEPVEEFVAGPVAEYMAPATELVAEPAAEAVSEPPAEAFATETMAELYVRQGLRHEAIAVYRQLVSARPSDFVLRARLEELEAGGRPVVGSTARSFFANLAGRRATPRSGSAVAPTPIMAVDAIPEPAPVYEPDAPPVEAVPAPVGVTGGTLDALFGDSPVQDPDDSAAQSLAAAFGSSGQSVTGRPTRAAADEVSLDRVFREPTPTPAKGGLAVPRQSSTLRFDQFFQAGGDAPAAPPPDAAPKEPGSDSEQFQSWLSGLKKP